MELEHKPDFERAKTYWNALWNGAIIDRPCVSVTAPKQENQSVERPPYMAGYKDGCTYEEVLRSFDRWTASTYFGGEAFPLYEISFGPDMFSAFLGAELTVADDRRTSWVTPFVSNWGEVTLELDRDNSLWKEMLAYLRFAAEFSKGKFLLSMLDLHSNMDCLGAIRGAENLCLDILDDPDDIDRMMKQVRLLYAPMYEGLYEAGDMKRRGSAGWAPFYCDGKFATIQCDYICLFSPDQSRRFIIPALQEEASFLDHTVYHLDGPGALVHLPDILAIPEIDVIQWVTGAGNPPIIEWIDLLKTIQEAGKGLEIHGTIEEVKRFHKELRPEGVLYCVNAASRQDADNLISWLKQNT